MQLRGKIGILALAIAVTAGLAFGFLPRPAQVDVAEVKRAPLAVTVEEEGKTRVRERYRVSAPVAGMMRRSALKAGDAVSAGQVIVLDEADAAGAAIRELATTIAARGRGLAGRPLTVSPR